MQRSLTLIDRNSPESYAGFCYPYEYLDPDMFKIDTRLAAIKRVYQEMMDARNILVAKMKYGYYGLLVGRATSKDFPWGLDNRPVYAIIHRDTLVLAVQSGDTFDVVLANTATGSIPGSLLKIWEYVNASEHSPATCSGIGMDLSRWNSLWFDLQFDIPTVTHHHTSYNCADVLSEFLDQVGIFVEPTEVGIGFTVDKNLTVVGRGKQKYTPSRSTELIELTLTYVTAIEPGTHPDLCFIQGPNINRIIIDGLHFGRHVPPNCFHVGYGARFVGLALYHGLFPKELTPVDHFNMPLRAEGPDVVPGNKIEFNILSNLPKRI